jgi:predicted amidohydrolase YtcJ
MIALDRDITAIPPTEIQDTNVTRTVFAGETVYSAQ